MAASLRDIAGWFERGKKECASYMIVVCDTFDHDDYPVYVGTHSDFYTVYDRYSGGQNMQRIMEVYDLSKPWSQQTSGRVMNVPPRPAQIESVTTEGETNG